MKQMEEEYVGRSTKGQKVRAFTFFLTCQSRQVQTSLNFCFYFFVVAIQPPSCELRSFLRTTHPYTILLSKARVLC